MEKLKFNYKISCNNKQAVEHYEDLINKCIISIGISLKQFITNAQKAENNYVNQILMLATSTNQKM